MPSDHGENEMPDLVRQFLQARARARSVKLSFVTTLGCAPWHAASSSAGASRNRSTSPMTALDSTVDGMMRLS